jgi:competence protein ComER
MTDPPLKILIVGTGRLAAVLCRVSLRASCVGEVAVLGRNTIARDALVAAHVGLRVGHMRTAEQADLVILAVAPDAYRQVVHDLSAHLSPSTILVSVTNAVALDEIGLWTPHPVVKVIPTIAQIVGRGTTTVTAGARAGPREIAIVSAWLREFSAPVAVDDIDIRVASNVSGSAVAIFARLARAFVDANASRAVKLDRKALDGMMAETLIAVGELVRTGVAFEEIVASTATPGGVTEAMINAAEQIIDATCRNMVDVGFQRQAELQARQTLPLP